MHKGPVTVRTSDYGERLDNQPVSRSATVDDVPDFVNLYDYDAEGNRTRRTEIATGEVTEYTWDHRNRLVRVTTRTTDNGPLTTDTQYAYDYLNRWIARSHDPDGDGPLSFTDTYFVYDGTPPSGSLLDRTAVTMENIGQIVLHFEADAQGDPQLAHRYLWGPAVDQILADEQVTDPTAPGNVVWPLTDHLNTVRDLAAYDADTDTTTIVNHLIYDAYGRITSQSDPDQTTLFALTARPFDPATGLQNNLNRWYDAEVGRWLSEDPSGFEGGDANLYRYVENAGTSMVDPNGLEPLPNLTDTERRVLELAGEDRQLHATLVQLLGIIRRTKARPKELPRDYDPRTNQGYCKRYTEALIEALNAEYMDKRGIRYVEIYRAYIGPMYPLYTTHWLVQVTVDGQTFYVDNYLNGGRDHISFEFVDTLVPDGSAEEREFHK